MGLNKISGNMYDFITHTWNTIKGECYHNCSYCYMKRWGKQKPIRFDEKELKTDLGKGNFIFVGSSNDMFASNIPELWIRKTIKTCENFDNKYLFQTKNPDRFYNYIGYCVISDKSVICTTIESNRNYPDIQRNCPDVINRVVAMKDLSEVIETYVTVEPIMDFDLRIMIQMLKDCGATQINIGADSQNKNLPEPPKEKIKELIKEIEKFTKVKLKKNLSRLLK